MSSQITTVRQYIEKIDNHEVDSGQKLVTDDFKFILEPNPSAKALPEIPTMSSSGYNKAEYKALHNASAKYNSDYKVQF